MRQHKHEGMIGHCDATVSVVYTMDSFDGWPMMDVSLYIRVCVCARVHD